MVYLAIGLIGFLFGRYGIVIFDNLLEWLSYILTDKFTQISLNTEAMKIEFSKEYNVEQDLQEGQPLIGFEYPNRYDEDYEDYEQEIEDKSKRFKNKRRT